MNKRGFISDSQYDLLIGCFKCKLPRKVIAEITGLSMYRVCTEWERWRLCNAVTRLRYPEKEPTWNQTHPSNMSKVFGY